MRVGAVPRQKPLAFPVNQGQYFRLLRRLAFVLRDIAPDRLLPVLGNVRVLHHQAAFPLLRALSLPQFRP